MSFKGISGAGTFGALETKLLQGESGETVSLTSRAASVAALKKRRSSRER
jgi:hypothetical protein